MPYHVGKSESCPASKPYAVIKDSDGEVLGCHETKESAESQITAINLNESKSWQAKMDEVLNDFKKES